ncbi:MAG: hypothetical protein PHQ35_07610 [Phycisphaerae bacterium]|nr:hypothetical protein [Phycisphaerae bacterium]MDD5380028.1 hypothetical protein [Phycisphaerae bacterium]
MILRGTVRCFPHKTNKSVDYPQEETVCQGMVCEDLPQIVKRINPIGNVDEDLAAMLK